MKHGCTLCCSAGLQLEPINATATTTATARVARVAELERQVTGGLAYEADADAISTTIYKILLICMIVHCKSHGEIMETDKSLFIAGLRAWCNANYCHLQLHFPWGLQLL